MKRARFQIPDYPADRPRACDVAKLIAAHYKRPGNGAGGNLHVVTDDGNLDADTIQWCLERCLEKSDESGAAIAAALLKMTKTQRRKACASF